VYVWTDGADQPGMYIFGNQSLLDQIIESGLYRYEYQHTPSQADKDAYWMFVKANKLTRSEIPNFTKIPDDAIWQELEA
jgi:hypothetical protein